MFRYILLLISFVYLISSYAAELTYEVYPHNIRENQNFKIIFQTSSFSSKVPFFTFQPRELEVISKQVKTRKNTYNDKGKIKLKTTYFFEYILFAGRKGNKRIENIILEDNGQYKTIAPISIRVLGKPRKPRKVFVEAEVDKRQIYKGEGISVDYYLYFDRNVALGANAIDVREFPKLNNFLKRYLKKPGKIQAINYNGFIINRTNLYSARIFPQKEGNLKIDPIRITVDIYKRGRFNRNKTEVLKLQSKSFNVKVNALPKSNKKTTGLVGEHQFKVHLKRQRFFVNEPIEIFLEVVGPGELENMAQPHLYTSSDLEMFDVKSDLKDTDKIMSRKMFEYTFLARKEISVKESVLELSYFLPKENKYQFVEVKVPEIIVKGKQGSGYVPREDKKEKKEKRKTPVVVQATGLIFKNPGAHFSLIRILIYLLLVINLILFTGIVKSVVTKLNQKDEVEKLMLVIKEKGLEYSLLYRLFQMLEKDNDEKQLSDIIERSNLGSDAKTYFLQIADICATKAYSNESAETFKYNNNYFYELKKLIRDESCKVNK